MTSAARRAFLVSLLLAGAACQQQLGEALIIVDTDLPVPQIISRLRVDLYSEDGRWYESRDIALPDPLDWPASFGIYSNDQFADKRVLARIRAYPEGRTRPYLGERYQARPAYAEPFVAHSVDEMCDPAHLPVLDLGASVWVRRGDTKFPGLEFAYGKDCNTFETVHGAAAVAVDIAEAGGSYVFGVLETTPQVPNVDDPGTQDPTVASCQVTLELRPRCSTEDGALACATGIITVAAGPFGSTWKNPVLTVSNLAAGRYYLGAGTASPLYGACDMLLAAAAEKDWPQVRRPSTPVSALPPDQSPRLQQGGAGADPTTEPQPDVTVDRLLAIRLEPAVRGSVRVNLSGACAGTMARLGDVPYQPSLESARTCVATTDELEPIADADLDPDMSVPATGAQGTFASDDGCPVPAADASAVCVPGGVFLFGDAGSVGFSEADDGPERIARMSRFWMDGHEVTVGDWRRAKAAGFKGWANEDSTIKTPISNDGPIQLDPALRNPGTCTWSAQPMDPSESRENYPINCVSWYTARAYCVFNGGDLPTEAQWEYAATAAGRPFETRYPWGNDPPDCSRAVFGRLESQQESTSSCVTINTSSEDGAGPLPTGARARGGGDLVLGIADMAGSMSEFVRDPYHGFSHPCWRGAAFLDPACIEEEAPLRGARGGAWSLPSTNLAAEIRHDNFNPYSKGFSWGLRCVYDHDPGPTSP